MNEHPQTHDFLSESLPVMRPGGGSPSPRGPLGEPLETRFEKQANRNNDRRHERNGMSQKGEVQLSKSRILRLVFGGVGMFSLVLGIIGIFLPVLPTTPFLLLSAACFAKSSRRFYDRLMGHPIFGKIIRGFREERRIPVRAKLFAVTMIALTIGISVGWVIPLPAVKILVGLIGIAVILYIAGFPS